MDVPAIRRRAPSPMKRRSKRILIIALAALACVAIFVASPLFPLVRSLAVMGVYSGMHESEALPAEEGFALRIPGGLSTPQADWYPFAMTFVADASYAWYCGQPDARLTILYNFPSFDYAKGCSRLFDAESPYYNGFYGAYVVRDSSNAALAAGQMDVEAVADIARFDFFHLVLGDFGLRTDAQVFQFDVTEQRGDVSFAGMDGWSRIQADIVVNGASHNRRDGVTSYLQYGAPNFGPVEEEFSPVPISAILYGRYFPEWDAGVYFYAMGDEQVVADCDARILSQSRIEAR